MVKRLLMAVVIIVASSRFLAAQNTSIGLRAGINFQNITGKDNSGNTLNNKLLVGFNGGLMIDNYIAPDWNIQPGILFSTKGAKSNSGSVKTHFSYIEIPLNVIYQPALNKSRVLLGAGPYIAFAVAGNEASSSGTRKIEFKSKLSISDLPNTTRAYYKGFDAGFNFLAGYLLSNNFSVQLNAQLGLANLQPDYPVSGYNAKLKNTGFGISVGYHFPVKKN